MPWDGLPGSQDWLGDVSEWGWMEVTGLLQGPQLQLRFARLPLGEADSFFVHWVGRTALELQLR